MNAIPFNFTCMQIQKLYMTYGNWFHVDLDLSTRRSVVYYRTELGELMCKVMYEQAPWWQCLLDIHP